MEDPLEVLALISDERKERRSVVAEERSALAFLKSVEDRLWGACGASSLKIGEKQNRRVIVCNERLERFTVFSDLKLSGISQQWLVEIEKHWDSFWGTIFEQKENVVVLEQRKDRSALSRSEDHDRSVLQREFESTTRDLVFHERKLALIVEETKVRQTTVLDTEEFVWTGLIERFSEIHQQILTKVYRDLTAALDETERSARAVVLRQFAEDDLILRAVDFPDFVEAVKNQRCTEAIKDAFVDFTEGLLCAKAGVLGIVEGEKRAETSAAESLFRRDVIAQHDAEKQEIQKKESTFTIQRLYRGHRGRQRAKFKREAAEGERALARRQLMDNCSIIITAHLIARNSSLCVNERRMRWAATLVSNTASGFSCRNRVATEYRRLRTAAAALIQRVGRGFQEREEAFEDFQENCGAALEQWQLRTSAALSIQWMWRRVQAKDEAAAIANRLRIESHRNRSATKIQSLYRRMVARILFLVKLSEHRDEQLCSLQRIIRGYGGRRETAYGHRVSLINAFCRGAQSLLRVLELKNWDQIVCIQRAFRTYSARKQAAASRAKRFAKEEKQRKSGAAILFQSAFRGHSVRRKQRMATEKALEQRRSFFVQHGLGSAEDIQRIGRAFVARKELGCHRATMLGSLAIVARFIHAKTSEHDARSREDAVVDALQRKLLNKYAVVLQRQCACKLANRAIRHQIDLHEETVQSKIAALAVLQQSGRGLADRRAVFAIAHEREYAATVVQSCCRASVSHRLAAKLENVLIANTLREKLLKSILMIQRLYRCFHRRRRLAAGTIQVNFLKNRIVLARRAELNSSWKSYYRPLLQRVAREQMVNRTDILRDEDAAFKSLRRECTSRCHGPAILLPDSFLDNEQQFRLTIHMEAIGFWREAITLEKEARDAAATRSTAVSNAQGLRSAALTEATMRSRIASEQVAMRRTMWTAFRNGIKRVFAPLFHNIELNERVARGRIDTEYGRWCDMAVIERSRLEIGIQTEAAAREEEEREAAAALVQEPEPKVENEAEPAVPIQSHKSRFVRKLRAFSKQPAKGKSTLAPVDQSNIRGSAEGELTAPSVCTAIAGTVVCKDAPDAEVPHIVSLCAEQGKGGLPVTIDASHSQLSSNGVIRLIQAVLMKELTISAIRLTDSPDVDDVGALHLAHALSNMKSVKEVDLSGTAVSQGKRALVQHLLSSQTTGSGRNAVELQTSPPSASAVRPNRILLPPRRTAGFGPQGKARGLLPSLK